ncbi:MAG: hypothetical protein ABJB12_21740 [Pseudomonadota bacterium]
MRRRFSSVGVWALRVALGALVLAAPRDAAAVPKAKAHAAATRKPTPKNPKKAAPEAAAPDQGAKGSDTSADKPADKPDKGEPGAVKAAGTAAAKSAAPSAADGATVKEDKSGVKTYKFGTVEVEGRLKSPQIIYFLRRVRAEFDAGLLGHRSFMRELSDTRNNPALR